MEQVVLTIAYIIIGVLCLWIGIKCLKMLNKVDHFHTIVIRDFKVKLSETNYQLDQKYDKLLALNDSIETIHDIFEKIESFFK